MAGCHGAHLIVPQIITADIVTRGVCARRLTQRVSGEQTNMPVYELFDYVLLWSVVSNVSDCPDVLFYFTTLCYAKVRVDL